MSGAGLALKNIAVMALVLAILHLLARNVEADETLLATVRGGTKATAQAVPPTEMRARAVADPDDELYRYVFAGDSPPPGWASAPIPSSPSIPSPSATPMPPIEGAVCQDKVYLTLDSAPEPSPVTQDGMLPGLDSLEATYSAYT
jgi:hypothetical protein